MKARSFNISDDIYKQLSELAKKQGRTVSEIVREALIKVLKEYEK